MNFSHPNSCPYTQPNLIMGINIVGKSRSFDMNMCLSSKVKSARIYESIQHPNGDHPYGRVVRHMCVAKEVQGTNIASLRLTLEEN